MRYVIISSIAIFILIIFENLIFYKKSNYNVVAGNFTVMNNKINDMFKKAINTKMINEMPLSQLEVVDKLLSGEMSTDQAKKRLEELKLQQDKKKGKK